MTNPFKAINWNRIQDQIDLMTWDKLHSQFWLPERINVAGDVKDWSNLSPEEKTLYNRVFGGLTMLDTLQSEEGAYIMQQHSRTQHEKAVWSQITMMECLTEGHKLLTPQGWKDISEIKKGDIVLQYNADGTAQFEPVLNTSSHIPEKLYRFHNKKFDLKVSGGHRMVYEKTIQSKSGKKNDWTLEEMTAEEYMTAPTGTYYKRNILHNRGFNSSNTENELTPMEQLIIAIQADGSVRKTYLERETATNCRITFEFKKKRKIDRLLNIISEINDSRISLKEGTPRTDKVGRRNFSIILPKELLKDFDNTKTFSDYFNISDFSQSKADKFIEELSQWDSHISTEYENVITYYTANEQNAEFIKAIGTLSSWFYTFKKRVDNRKETYKDSYSIRFTLRECNAYHGFQSEIYKEEIKPERVYGVEVPSTYLMVMTPKGLVVTGNCVHARSYSTIFTTLCTPREIDEIFKWTEENEYIQKKAKLIQDVYRNGTPLQIKVAGVFLESFSFYSGFFTPLYYVGMGKMSNVAEIIKLISNSPLLK